MEQHDKASLAYRLELCNALRKQAERDRAKAEIELGKMTAYGHELEHRIEGLQKRIREIEDPINRQRMMAASALVEKDNLLQQYKKGMVKLTKQISTLRRDNKKLLVRIGQLHMKTDRVS